MPGSWQSSGSLEPSVMSKPNALGMGRWVIVASPGHPEADVAAPRSVQSLPSPRATRPPRIPKDRYGRTRPASAGPAEQGTRAGTAGVFPAHRRPRGEIPRGHRRRGTEPCSDALFLPDPQRPVAIPAILGPSDPRRTSCRPRSRGASGRPSRDRSSGRPARGGGCPRRSAATSSRNGAIRTRRSGVKNSWM